MASVWATPRRPIGAGDDARPGCLCAHWWPDGLTRARLCPDLARRGDTHLFSDARHRSELERILGRSDEKLSAHQIAREADRRLERQRQQQDLGPELGL